MVTQSEKKPFILFQNKGDCCGCGACMNICPKQAITLAEDEYGFLYPQINAKLCIHCSKCKRVCTYQNVNFDANKDINPIAAYVAAIKEEDLIMKSSSGGVFAAAALQVLDSGGVVFGAALDFQNNTFVPHHIFIRNKQDLNRIQGSKYVQSDIGDTYKEAEEILKSGKEVLFSGTPCQIAGLRGFLGKDYPGLMTMDFICHGVPSARMFQDYLKELMAKYNGSILEFKFRDKTKGWGTDSKLTYKDSLNKEKIKLFPTGTSSYFQFFLHAEIQRENCYSCKFTSRHDLSDITLGDYWGIQKAHPELMVEAGGIYSDKKGISCIIVNSEKGMQFLQSMQNKLHLEKSTFEKVARGNEQLNHPSRGSSNREKIMQIYLKQGYPEVEKYFRKRSGMKIYYSYLKSILPKDFKRTFKRFYRKILK